MGKILDMRRTMGSQEVLPKGVVPIEYLQSSSGAFINLSYVPRISPRIEFECKFESGGDVDIFGFASNKVPSFIGNVTPSANGIGFGYYRYYDTSGYGVGFSEVNFFSKWHIIDASNSVFVNDVVVAAKGKKDFSLNNQSVRLFASRSVFGGIKISWCNLYDGEKLVRECIPVRKDDIGYMYDRVSKQLFGNAGTGAFILGSDK